MSSSTFDPASYFRTLLILGRTSNLPTVWSNCLAGWILGGEGNLRSFLLLGAGATLLYLGGMFLNDAFDEDFDRQHRKERPIPAGQISANAVWAWGVGLLVAGMVPLMLIGRTSTLLTLCLIASILLYDAVHKAIAVAPIIMAACRFFLFLVAASAGTKGVTGTSIWCGLALASYIIGLSFIARKESSRGALQYWPCLFLGAPALLSIFLNAGPFATRGLILSVIEVVWVAWCLQHAYWKAERNIGYSVGGLLAGIVFVDLLAVAPDSIWLALTFVLLFFSARLFQRFVPAT